MKPAPAEGAEAPRDVEVSEVDDASVLRQQVSSSTYSQRVRGLSLRSERGYPLVRF